MKTCNTYKRHFWIIIFLIGPIVGVENLFAQQSSSFLSKENKTSAEKKRIERILIQNQFNTSDINEIRKLKSKPLNNSLENQIFKLNTDNKSRLLRSGGVDTGGGTIVTTVNGRKGLIDFFTHAPTLFGKLDKKPRLSVSNSQSLSKCGIAKIDLNSLGASSALLQRIERWRESSPLMVELLNSAINKIPVFLSTSHLSIQDRHYFIPEQLKNQIASFNTIAFYNNQIGLVISKPDFEDISYEDQLGLLMKEVLRHLQITYEIELTPEQMQHLNALLAMGPDGDENLDSISYLSQSLSAKVSDQELLNLFRDNILYDINDYFQRRGLMQYSSQDDIIRAIDSLNKSLVEEENEDERIKIRRLQQRAFRVLDWTVVNRLESDDIHKTQDLRLSISPEKLMIEVFLKEHCY